MNQQHFIAKQTAKYYWKTLKHTARIDTDRFRTEEDTTKDSFWEYEQTPRAL